MDYDEEEDDNTFKFCVELYCLGAHIVIWFLIGAAYVVYNEVFPHE